MTNNDPTGVVPDRTKPEPASPRENLVTLVGGVWLVVGLFVDGYAHSEIIDTETEDFITPWHALFYSGFLFTTMQMAIMANRRADSARPWKWMPAGYGLAVLGLVVFSLGGIGDAIWHTIFGIETGLDALLSPTHLLLFAGLLLILTAPLRAVSAKHSPATGWRELGVPIASATLATSLLAFIFTFSWGLSESWNLETPFDPITTAGEIEAELALATGFVTTALLLLPALTLLRRWYLPFGAVTLLWTIPSTLEWLAFGNDGVATPAALFGGVAFEATLRCTSRLLDRRHSIVAAAVAGGTVLWSARALFLALTSDVGIQWPPELWSGQIAFGAFIAFALANLALPSTNLAERQFDVDRTTDPTRSPSRRLVSR